MNRESNQAAARCNGDGIESGRARRGAAAMQYLHLTLLSTVHGRGDMSNAASVRTAQLLVRGGTGDVLENWDNQPTSVGILGGSCLPRSRQAVT
ncbi:hypothetical protein E4U41_002517 [Claviceps citrina]|nr:hypothetical protein E4U41_002517 [Claviceps citrina]